jgi:HK97 family phage prohead protease
VVAGYAIVYDRLSEDLGGFRERFARGSLRSVLEAGQDVRFMVSHGAGADGLPLARVSNGTLQLAEDDTGLRFAASLNPDMTAAGDLVAAVQRRDASQMSFAFMVDPDRGGRDRWHSTSAGPVRTVKQASDLLEISAVALPAYPTTTIAA